MQTKITFHPGSRAVGGEHKAVVRVFENGKPVGSKTRPETFSCAAMARAFAILAAERAAIRTGAFVVLPRA